MGMVSALGPLVHACAAFRAGITRMGGSRDFMYFNQGDEAPEPVQIFEIPTLTYGFSGVGRLVVITMEVIRDLLRHTQESATEINTKFFVALPDPFERAIYRDEINADDIETRVSKLGRIVLDQALENLGIPKVRATFFGGNHVAGAKALEGAIQAISSGICNTAIVIGVDSLVAPHTLEFLDNEDRIKRGNNPAGFMPGEGGAALLLAADSGSYSYGQRTTIVCGVHTEFEPNGIDSDAPPDGRAMAQCVRPILNGTNVTKMLPTLVSDHNGESHRAVEWGNFQMQLSGRGYAEVNWTSWLPALGFGELGAAYAAVAVCLSARSVERGYAPSNSFIILCADDGGERAACGLSAIE